MLLHSIVILIQGVETDCVWRMGLSPFGGGLDTVLKSYKVESVYAPKVSHTTDTFKDFLTAVKAENSQLKKRKLVSHSC